MTVPSGKGYFEAQERDFLTRSLLPGQRVLLAGKAATRLAGEIPSGHLVPLEHLDVRNLERDLPSRYHAFFDYIVLHDYVEWEGDLLLLFRLLRPYLSPGGKIFVLWINPLAVWFLKCCRAMGLRTPGLEHNILRLGDVANLVDLCGYEVVDKGYRFHFPFFSGRFGTLVNGFLARFPGVRRLAFGQYVVCRARPGRTPLSCTVVVPCYNEEANVIACLRRIPEFGVFREIIVVDDGSRDRTAALVEEFAACRPDVKLIRQQPNQGKGAAIKAGFAAARGDVLMMLDCDMTTPPEEMADFHAVMEEGAEFINGTRVVYPREARSLKLLNRLGVSFFAALIGWVLQQRITDTFCGTKVFLRRYRSGIDIKENLWGDWDLFFAAKRFRMKMVEMPVHYLARRAGKSKMQPFRHGMILVWKALAGIREVP